MGIFLHAHDTPPRVQHFSAEPSGTAFKSYGVKAKRTSQYANEHGSDTGLILKMAIFVKVLR